MSVLSTALVVAAIVGAFVVGGALDRGFPVEVALVRGSVAFMAIAFTGYLGELVVVTNPRRGGGATNVDRTAAPTSAPHAPPQLAPLAPQTTNEDESDADLQQAA